MKPTYRDRDPVPPNYPVQQQQQPLVVNSSSTSTTTPSASTSTASTSSAHHHHPLPNQHHHHHVHHSNTNSPSQQHQQQQQQSPNLQSQSQPHSNTHHHHHSRTQLPPAINSTSTSNSTPITNFTGPGSNSAGGFKHEGSLAGPGSNNYPGEFSAFGNNSAGIAGGNNVASNGTTGVPIASTSYGYSPYPNDQGSRMDSVNQQHQIQSQQQQQQQIQQIHQQQQQQSVHQSQQQQQIIQAQQQQQQQIQNQNQNQQQQIPSTSHQSMIPMIPRIPLADRDIFMLSLPSQDLPHYYDPESASDTEAPTSLTTNRGHKLLPSARHVRRGRLGSYPHTDLGFAPTSVTKRQKTLAGTALSPSEGFSIAPNLHLLKSDFNQGSNHELKLLTSLPPPPQTPLDLLLSSSLQHTLGAKNQTFKILGMSATGLIEQEGELIGSLQRVCSAVRGEGFEWRWPGDEERKVEREKERAKEKEVEEEKDRLEDILRVEREMELMKENERIRIEEEKNLLIRLEVEKIERERIEELNLIQKEVERKRIEEISRIQKEQLAIELQQQQEQQRKEQEEKDEANRLEEEMKELAASKAMAATTSSLEEGEIISDELPIASSSTLPATLDSDAMDVTTDESTSALPSTLPPLPSLLVTPSTETGGAEGESSEIKLDINSLPSLPALPSLDSEMNEDNSLTVPKVTIEGVGEEEIEVDESPEEPLIRRRSGRVASRVPGENGSNNHGGNSHGAGLNSNGGINGEDLIREGSTESSNSDTPALASGSGLPGNGLISSNGLLTSPTKNGMGSTSNLSTSTILSNGVNNSLMNGVPSSIPNRRKRIAEEEMPEYAKRLVDPEIYVRSLFVSESSVEMPVNSPNNNGLSSGQFDLLSPNEQEVMVHDCLTDLHRFLADSLEYRSRLSEIRDGVLGVERRRKGLWKVVRMVAADWLEEESNAQENE